MKRKRSLINKLKNNGPRIEPCGTHLKKESHIDFRAQCVIMTQTT